MGKLRDKVVQKEWSRHAEEICVRQGRGLQKELSRKGAVARRADGWARFLSYDGGGHYCGDHDIWYFPALAMRDTVIEKGDRICQFRIMEKMPAVAFETVEFLSAPDRGGIGSTGEK